MDVRTVGHGTDKLKVLHIDQYALTLATFYFFEWPFLRPQELDVRSPLAPSLSACA